MSSHLLFGTELTGFHETPGHIEATVADRRTGATRQIQARYLVAADGSRSSVRDALGITLHGVAGLGKRLNILFRANVTSVVSPRHAVLYLIINERVNGMLRRADGGTRWLLATTWEGEVTDDLCRELATAAIGRPLDMEILSVGEWEAAARLASRFGSGQVVLAGDAAHQTTPAGGLGMNLGIQEAHNLAWKLAAVIDGWAGPALIDTYAEERRPVAAAVVNESQRLMTDGSRSIARTLGLALGHHHDRGALVPDGTGAPEVADPVTDYAPCARPGHRTPHVWLDGDRTRSTLDLVGPRFSLLTGDASAWSGVTDLPRWFGVPLTIHHVSGPDWRETYGVETRGAVLVRPDGFVAARWATRPEQPVRVVAAALEAMLKPGPGVRAAEGTAGGSGGVAAGRGRTGPNGRMLFHSGRGPARHAAVGRQWTVGPEMR